MKLLALATTIVMMMGCSKKQEPGAGTAAGSGSGTATADTGSGSGTAGSGTGSGSGTAGSSTAAPVAGSAWAADRPASVPADAVALLDALRADVDAHVGDLSSSDCAKAAAGIQALTPSTKALSDRLDAVDALMKTDATAAAWLTGTYLPRLEAVMTSINSSIKNTACRDDAAWRDAAMAWAAATGASPPSP